MTSNTKQFIAPSLNDLMIRFLANRSDATNMAAVESSEGEVELYEVASGFRVDHRNAWKDAIAPVIKTSVATPTEWQSFVQQAPPVFALAMAAGNFPQRIRDPQPLLASASPAELRPVEQPPSASLSGLRTWIIHEIKQQSLTSSLLAAGVARAIGEFDWAGQILTAAETQITPDSRCAWENEWAALQWHMGRCEEALALWSDMEESSATLFNRGMAMVFLGQFAEGRMALEKSIQSLPTTGGWHSLAGLYISVAEMHS